MHKMDLLSYTSQNVIETDSNEIEIRVSRGDGEKTEIHTGLELRVEKKQSIEVTKLNSNSVWRLQSAYDNLLYSMENAGEY